MESSDYGGALLDELGEKVLQGVAQAVNATRADRSEYRRDKPAWVAQHSERGLANWIHDRIWQHLVEQLADDDNVRFSDCGPLREFRVGTRYLFRAKRHSRTDKIASFPTPTAIAFWGGGQLSLFPHAAEVRLAVGYRWDPELREIDEAVISLRDGVDNVVWAVTVGFAATTGAVELWPVSEDAPELPTVLLDEEADADDDDETGSE
ncbi:MAG: hypothetical protein DLM59_19850 [Pseudonocardiales bacterium]|nr:MAG: hypothetical protein DLM59_19850 [Pseudonocardiales bacterium]